MSAVIPIKRAHALLSPSAAHRWMVCGGSLAQEKGLPDSSSEYSEEGTCAHSVAAACLTEGLDAVAYVGRRFDVSPVKTYEFREDMAEPVQFYVDAVRARMDALKQAGAVSVELRVEQEVPIGHITGEEGATGTADVILIAVWPTGKALVEVRDLKFGRGIPVRAEENKQGMLYALGALHEVDLAYDIERVNIVIHQPRLGPPSEWEVDVQVLRDFSAQATYAANFAMRVYNGDVYKPGPVGLVAGEEQCQWCKAKPTCPEFARYVKEAAGADFEVLSTASVTGLTVDQLVPNDVPGIAQKFKSLSMLEMFIKAVRAKAEAMLYESFNSEEMRTALGIKIVQGKKGDRAWLDDEQVKALFKKTFRLKDDDMYTRKLISPTVAEKLLKKAAPDRWAKTEKLIGQKEGQPTVVPLDDKREPLVLKPTVDDFEVVNDMEGLA